MDNNSKIRLKKLSDLIQEVENPINKPKKPKGRLKAVCESESDSDFVDPDATPKRAKHQKGRAPITSKKTSAQPNMSKKLPRSYKKEPPPSQTKIDTFFKSCSKSYQVGKADLNSANEKVKVNQTTGGKFHKNRQKNVRNIGRGRKRLFYDTTETGTDTTTAPSCISGMTLKKSSRKRCVKNNAIASNKINSKKKSSVVECIDLISESEEENCTLIEKTEERTCLTSASASVNDLQINYAKYEETASLANINTSDEITTPAVRNEISTCPTNAPDLGNNPELDDLLALQNSMQYQSSEIEEDIGTLILREEDHQLQLTKDEGVLFPAYVNNAGTVLQTRDKEEHVLPSCPTNNPPLVNIGIQNNVINHQKPKIVDIDIIQKEEKSLCAKCNKELRDIEINAEKSTSLVYVSSGEEDSLPLKIRWHGNSNNSKGKTKRSDLEPLISIHVSKNVPEKVTSKEECLLTLVQRPSSTNINQDKSLLQANEATTLNTTPEDVLTKKGTKKRKTRPLPPYKVVAGTTFAVDAFQFGLIKGVTHYFLSHFHADHYIGLTRKFAMPLFCSPVTARLIQAFIPLEESLVHEIELNEPQIVEGVEVTAIDANHCPGAVMFVFKLPTGKCILHTGDFRASPNMESEPIFWNNDIHTIYLDTTYISNKYTFCSQDESLEMAKHLIEQFQEKHEDKKILYICGAYVIGKERIWSTIARNNRLSVWTEARRNKALTAMQNSDYLDLLCANPISATMHVIPLGKLSYFSLVEYFEPFSSHFDICLAIRPSGWEKNSKPQYRGKINIIGVEYSEHSSYNELQRFVTYLNPQEVISTVPASGDLMITGKVPKAWYKYKKFPTNHRNYQPSITNYLRRKKNNLLCSEKNEESSKENFLPNQSSQSDVFEDVKCSKIVSTDKISLLHAAGDADDDWLS